MSHVIKLESAPTERPGGPLLELSDRTIRTDAVYVIYTSIDDTLAAVRVAGDFAKALDVPVTLIHFRTVPYALPLDAPCGISPVETEAFIGRLPAEGLDLRVRVCLCRDRRQAIPLAFTDHSLIVIAGQRSWWPTESTRWRRMLETTGHFVVFVDRSDHSVAARARLGGVTLRAAKKERSLA
jgi:hypothetical protein